MKKLLAFTCLSLLTIIFCLKLDAQKLTLNSWKDRINQFSAQYPQEKVYLFLDNNSYYLGDTLWFKAYVVTTPALKNTTLSKTLYIDLVSQDGYIIKSQILRIENGGCSGAIILQKPLESGFCEIRAYTRYMMNFGQENLYSRVLPVYEKLRPGQDASLRLMTSREFDIPDKRLKEQPVSKKKTKTPNDVFLHFYPEGGNLVRGMENQVAFKVTDSDGRNLDINASLFSGKTKILENIKTLHHGMGLFTFTPKNGVYTLNFNIKSTKYAIRLPKVESSGYVLNAENIDGDKLKISIHKSSNEPADSIGFCLTCRGEVCAYFPIYTDKKDYKFVFPWKDLPTGLIQINLFHKQGQLLNTRNVFTSKSLPLTIECKIDRTASDPGESILLKLSTFNAAGKPVPASLSLALRDAASQGPFISYASTYSALMLTSELKGYVQDPEWYFIQTDKTKLQALDLLMRTQDWTPYPWYRITGLAPFSLKQPIDQGILVSGKILPRTKKTLSEENQIYLQMDSAGTKQTIKFTTGMDGFFAFWTQIQGQRKLQLVDENDKRDMSIRMIPSPGASIQARQLDPAETALPVTIEPSAGISNSSLYYMTADINDFKYVVFKNASLIYDFESMNNFSISKPELPENVIKFLFQENKNFRLSNLGGNPGPFKEVTYKNSPVMFFDNKVRMTTDIMMQLLETRLQDLAQLVIVENRAFNNQFIENDIHSFEMSNKGNPICIFLFYKNDQIIRKRLNDKPAYQTFLLDGYNTPLTFKTAPFGSATLPPSKKPPRTLYWNPDLKTDSLGKAEVRIYLNQKVNELIVTAEGLCQ